jgi:hypothetical protein
MKINEIVNLSEFVFTSHSIRTLQSRVDRDDFDTMSIDDAARIAINHCLWTLNMNPAYIQKLIEPLAEFSVVKYSSTLVAPTYGRALTTSGVVDDVVVAVQAYAKHNLNTDVSLAYVVNTDTDASSRFFDYYVSLHEPSIRLVSHMVMCSFSGKDRHFVEVPSHLTYDAQTGCLFACITNAEMTVEDSQVNLMVFVPCDKDAAEILNFINNIPVLANGE